MNRRDHCRALLGACLLAGATLSGCVQMPTERASVADIRPQVSFRLVGDEARLRDAKVYVNGLEMGVAGDFREGRAALRVLSGTNQLRVVGASGVLLDQTVYLGDGVSRTFQLQ